jgi:hypothetical protein
MITVCNCPIPTALPDIITGSPCYENFGQIQRLVFWRSGYSLSVASAEIDSVWQDLLDDGIIAVTPYVSGATVAPGAAREYGGGNDTRNGIPIVLGSEYSVFDANLLRQRQEVIVELKKLVCEQLDVIFVNENLQLGYDERAGRVYGFPIAGLFVSDVSLLGYSEAQRNIIRFMLPANWSG